MNEVGRKNKTNADILLTIMDRVCNICKEPMWRQMISPENIQQVRDKQIPLWYCIHEEEHIQDALMS